ncbi:MAG: hypothetical protein KJZ54_09670 [Phycisphaerales bacterium]|nr:hypothetical protein [Phycisphaerales bacterium]
MTGGERQRRLAARAAMVAIACALVSQGGCASSRPADEDRRHVIPPAPADAPVSYVTLGVDAPVDEDRNGYPDTLLVTMYFWINGYPVPVHDDGGVRLTLSDSASGRELATWTMTEGMLAATRRRNAVGPVHLFQLDIRQASTDQFPATTTELTAVFTPSDGGAPADTPRPITFRMGGR